MLPRLPSYRLLYSHVCYMLLASWDYLHILHHCQMEQGCYMLCIFVEFHLHKFLNRRSFFPSLPILRQLCNDEYYILGFSCSFQHILHHRGQVLGCYIVYNFFGFHLHR